MYCHGQYDACVYTYSARPHRKRARALCHIWRATDFDAHRWYMYTNGARQLERVCSMTRAFTLTAHAHTENVRAHCATFDAPRILTRTVHTHGKIVVLLSCFGHAMFHVYIHVNATHHFSGKTYCFFYSLVWLLLLLLLLFKSESSSKTTKNK